MTEAIALVICAGLGLVVVVAGIIDDPRIRRKNEDRVLRYFQEQQKKMNETRNR